MPGIWTTLKPATAVRVKWYDYTKWLLERVDGFPKNQRFVLEIVRHQGKDEPLFEIRHGMAVGWMLGERPVEETWEEGE